MALPVASYHPTGAAPAARRRCFGPLVVHQAPRRISLQDLGDEVGQLLFLLGLWPEIPPITIWLFNIAIENGSFIDDFPIKTSIY